MTQKSFLMIKVLFFEKIFLSSVKFSSPDLYNFIWLSTIFFHRNRMIFLKNNIFVVHIHNGKLNFSLCIILILAVSVTSTLKMSMTKSHTKPVNTFPTRINYNRKSINIVITNNSIVGWLNESSLIVANWLQETKKTVNESSFNSCLVRYRKSFLWKNLFVQ